MASLLDQIIETGDVVQMHRVTRYDVKWGKPFGSRDYKSLVFASNPVGYWKMEEDTTAPKITVNLGSLGSTYDGAYQNDPTWVDATVDGCDKQVSLNGTDEYIDAGSPNLAGVATGTAYPLTIELWYTPKRLGVQQILIAKDNDGTRTEFRVEHTAANLVRLYMDDPSLPGSPYRELLSTTVLALDTQYHIVITMPSTGSPKMYINDVEEASSSDVDFLPRHGGNKLLIGAGRAITTVYGWVQGYIDEVALYTAAMAHAISSTHYTTGVNKIYNEPDEDIETDSLYTTSDDKTYVDTIDEADPDHWYRLGELAGVTTATDSGNTAVNGTYQASAANAQITGALAEDTDKGHQLASAGNMQLTISNMGLGTDGIVGAMTAEFWFKIDNTSTDLDGVMGWDDVGTVKKGFTIAIRNDKLLVRRYDPLISSPDFLWTTVMSRGLWYHAVATISTTGKMKWYLNGSLVASGDTSNFRGYLGHAAASTFRIGGVTGLTPLPTNSFDEVSLYDRELSSQEIATHYLKGRYGRAASSMVVGSAPDENSAPYELACSENAVLENGQDITKYVESWSMDRDITQYVDAATLNVHEWWGLDNITTLLRANTYVVIEQRFQSATGSLDTGWLQRGHFLVDGPAAKSITESGKIRVVPLRGLLKLCSLDIAHKNVEPDKLLVKKRALTNTSSDLNKLRFQCPRQEDSTKFYTNWAEFPSVRLWVTKFTNYSTTDQTDVSGPDDVLRIKGSEGSVQVLGGAGAIDINRAFYEDKVTSFGLGNPNPTGGVLAEFYRYGTREDLTVTTVASIANDGNWYITAAENNQEYDGKTIFVKSGAAKGKMFKVYQVTAGDTSSNFGTFANSARGGSAASWVNPSNAQTLDATFATATKAYPANSITTDYLRATAPSSLSIPSGVTINGIEVLISKKASQNLNHWWVQDSQVYIIKGGVQQTAQNKARTGVNWSSTEQVTIYGGPTDLWGQTWTTGDFASGFGVDLSALMRNTVNSSNPIIAYVNQVTVRVYYSKGNKLYIRDMNMQIISPEAEGLEVGDSIQIGDCNQVEDALRKVLLKCGFQENDITKPFYFQLDPCAVETTLPPLRYTLEENTRWSEVITEIMSYAPENYVLYCSSTGQVRAKNVVQVPAEEAEHDLTGVMDLSDDRSDYGLFTRVVTIGSGGSSVNVALNSAYGGSSAVRALKFDEYALYTSPRTQTEANAIMAKIFDTDPKTPMANNASTAGSMYNKAYGLIYEYKGADAKKWKFEDLDMFILDIGKNTSINKQYEIETLQFTWFNTYPKGNSIKQSMQIFYMTEEDYIAEFGAGLPDAASQTLADAATSYIPPANAQSWKMLIDEFNLEEGQTTVNSNDFSTERPTRFRFLKVRVGQNHYRYDIPNEDTNKYARVVMADMKVWTSTRIVALAELGSTAPYDTGQYKKLVTRLRRRTYVVDPNPYLDTYQKAKDFAAAELRERAAEFIPQVVNAWHPTIDITQTAKKTDPETGVVTTGIVKGLTLESNGNARILLRDYSTGV